MSDFVYQPPLNEISILYQDDSLLVVDKPSGLLSVPGKALEHRDCLEHRLRLKFPTVLVVHRLDMDTSGVMVFARNKHAQRYLNLQFERREVRKTYHAIVDGIVSSNKGIIDLPLCVDWPNRPLQKIDLINGKSARTKWIVQTRFVNHTAVALYPKTGRSHQLRVHMLAIGHPILGDRFYGSSIETIKHNRLYLHAASLELRHPENKTWYDFHSPSDFNI